MGGRKHWWRKKRKKESSFLIPMEWTQLPLYSAPIITFTWQISKEEVRAHLNSCFGNIYQREVYSYRLAPGGIYSKAVNPPKTENHLLLGALVGVGAYLSLTWLDLQTNKKWEESVRMEGRPEREWRLLSEMETPET